MYIKINRRVHKEEKVGYFHVKGTLDFNTEYKDQDRNKDCVLLPNTYNQLT